jgi:HEAT repeat protein
VKAPSPLERKLKELAEIRRSQPPDTVARLREFLAAKEAYLVAETAEAIADLGTTELLRELAKCGERLVRNPDKGCAALTKVVMALAKLEADEPDVYLAGLTVKKVEFAGDTAIPVRIECAHALVTIRHRDALVAIAPLLADKEPEVRAGVARAIGRLASDGAAAVLHLKFLLGDEPEVLGACCAGLLDAFRERYLPFVATQLDHEDERVAELAALALGDCREDGAVEALTRALENRVAGVVTGAILLGLALSRRDDATERLFTALEQGESRLAAQALSALSVLRDAPGVEKRAQQIAVRRGGAKLQEILATKFR